MLYEYFLALHLPSTSGLLSSRFHAKYCVNGPRMNDSQTHPASIIAISKSIRTEILSHLMCGLELSQRRFMQVV